MAVTATVIQDHPIRPPKTGLKTTLGRSLIYGLLAAMLIWSYQGAEIAPGKLFTDAGNIVTFARDFFPPDFHEWRYYLEELVVTLHIALWGTLLAVICAVPPGLPAPSSAARREGKECASTCESRWSPSH